MYAPVAHLEDCNWNHYCLQLSMYAYFLEQQGYSLSDMWIEHAVFEEDVVVDTIKYYVPYLKKEVEDICKDYLVKAFIDGEGRD